MIVAGVCGFTDYVNEAFYWHRNGAEDIAYQMAEYPSHIAPGTIYNIAEHPLFVKFRAPRSPIKLKNSDYVYDEII